MIPADHNFKLASEAAKRVLSYSLATSHQLHCLQPKAEQYCREQGLDNAAIANLAKLRRQSF